MPSPAPCRTAPARSLRTPARGQISLNHYEDVPGPGVTGVMILIGPDIGMTQVFAVPILRNEDILPAVAPHVVGGFAILKFTLPALPGYPTPWQQGHSSAPLRTDHPEGWTDRTHCRRADTPIMPRMFLPRAAVEIDAQSMN